MNANAVFAVSLALALGATPLGALHGQTHARSEPEELLGKEVSESLTPLELAVREFEDTGKARTIPPSHPGGFTVFPYGYSQAHLGCAALKLCQVELQPGEVLADEPLPGDRERWDVDQTWSGKVAVVVVKPKACDISTNLLIVTDRRRYVVDLEAPACEGTNPDDDYMPGIRFWYPGEELEPEAEPDPFERMLVDVRDLHTNYRWQTSRSVSWNPARVFDDGIRTIIQFVPEASAGEMPVLYGLTDDGTREQVNTIPRPDPSGDFLIADRVLKRGLLVLRDGERERKLRLDNLTLLRR